MGVSKIKLLCIESGVTLCEGGRMLKSLCFLKLFIQVTVIKGFTRWEKKVYIMSLQSSKHKGKYSSYAHGKPEKQAQEFGDIPGCY